MRNYPFKKMPKNVQFGSQEPLTGNFWDSLALEFMLCVNNFISSHLKTKKVIFGIMILFHVLSLSKFSCLYDIVLMSNIPGHLDKIGKYERREKGRNLIWFSARSAT